MKKILSIMLCAVMLLGTMMSVAVAADVPESGWELAEYGQKTIYTGAPVDDAYAPIVDGVINEGEYTTALEPFVNSNPVDGWWTGGIDCDNIELFFGRDEEYLYIGARFDNETLVANDEKIVWNDCSERIAIKLSPDATDMKPTERCDSAVNYEPDGSTNKDWGEFDSYVITVDDKVVTFECSFEIIGLMDTFGLDELERLYFSFILISANSHTPGDGEETWFAFPTNDAELLAKYPSMLKSMGILPHVLVLSADPDAAPVETEPTETEPTETEPTETEPTATEPTETEATGIDKPADEAPTEEGGCGSSIAAMGIALIATLGTAITVVAKKND